MRILHAPTNIAGQPYVLSRALRRLGHTSDVLVDQTHQFGYPEDIVFDYEGLPTPLRQLRKGYELLKLIRRYDVFHFYFGVSLFSEHRDLPLLRRAGRRIIFHFRGCDIRMRGLDLARHPVCACIDCPAPCESDPKKVALRDLAWRWADRVLVATPDLLEWVPDAELVTQAIDLEAWPAAPTPVPGKKRLVVLHAPSDRLIKGTAYVERAVANLQAKGFPLELRLLQGRPHTEIRQAFEEADIVIDQVLLGWYGNFAIEAMTNSRPVIAYIRDGLGQLAGYTPPILSATPDTLEQRLAELVEDARLRQELASAGRPFVAAIHDADKIARQLLACYSGPRR